MQTNKEAAIAFLKGENCDHFVNMNTVIKDVCFPGDRFFGADFFDPYGTGPDAWGVMWTNQGPSPQFDGNTVAKGFKMFDEMDEWRDHIHFPDFDKIHAKEALQGMYEGMRVDKENDVVSCLMLSGAFERMNQCIGFENALCAFYEYPDEVKEFFEEFCDYRIKCIELAHDVFHPEVIHMHDDWGTESNMFFDPELWREFIKPIERRYADRIHELGMIYLHHSCGYIKQIIPDLVEIGVDALEPVMLKNDVDDILKNYGEKITILGGVENRIVDAPDAAEEQIREEVRNSMDKYAHLSSRFCSYYIPTNEQHFNIFNDELDKYGKELFEKK